MEKVEITSMKINFSQNGNTLGTTSEYEELEISLEFPDLNNEPFYVIKTEGWSFDNLSEIAALIEKANKVLGEKKEKE